MSVMPVFSIVVPVLNEATGINKLVEHIRCLEGADCCEIIVVDGDSDGGTVNAIADGAVVRIIGEQSRARQMNAGAAIAKGEVLVFLHADTELPIAAIPRIAESLEEDAIVGGAFDAGIDTMDLAVRFVTMIARIKHRINRVPFGDQAIFLRRDYFEKIGGFKDIPLMEDIELMKRIKKRGDRIRIISLRVKTSARRWRKEGLVHGVLRNFLLRVLFSMGVSPEKLVRYYRKHCEPPAGSEI